MLEQIRAEQALCWKLVVNIQGKRADSPEAKRAAENVRGSELVKKLLCEIRDQGQNPCHPYSKWAGAHWVLSILADLGYPPQDQSLRPQMERVYCWLLGESHQRGIKTIEGKVRRCASQEGNALWYSLKLGLADERSEVLVENLLKWQWPDGGWNCDKRPEARNSSYNESLIPLRALALYAKRTGDSRAMTSVERAQELFLKRQLFKRKSDGQVINESFLLLHYPPYWHYDILSALVVFAENDWLDDPRLVPALDIIEGKRLPDGGFPAEEAFYRTTQPKISGYSHVSWGGVRKMVSNPFISVDALYVLKKAGRAELGEK